MPVAQFHLVAKAYPAEAIDALLREASHFYAAALYPEMACPPIERVRASIIDIAPEHWATGGKTILKGGVAAPYFTCLSLKGRPSEQLRSLMTGMTDLIVLHLGCDRAVVRGRLIEVEPDHWFIAGAPAGEARSSEVAARKVGRQ